MQIRDTTAKGCCILGKGLHFRSAEWRRLSEAGNWSDAWPEIDRHGVITGRAIGDDPGFLNVDDDAMISESEARAGRWVIDEDDCRAWPAMACCICNGEIETVGGWREGHNARPVADGRCCGDCNATRVIPARLGLILGKGKG